MLGPRWSATVPPKLEFDQWHGTGNAIMPGHFAAEAARVTVLPEEADFGAAWTMTGRSTFDYAGTQFE
jgi:hypothetical protein